MKTWQKSCQAWTFISQETLTVKEEMMPRGKSESLHKHQYARQFFYILEGTAIIEEEGMQYQVGTSEAFEVAPGNMHSITNDGTSDLRFLLISNPNADHDRLFGNDTIPINLNGRKFGALSNSESGEVSDETIFYYFQKGDIIWATYEGGEILFGTLSGQIQGNKLKFNYQHRNLANQFMTGICHTDIKLVDGKIQLHEKWKWTCADFSEGTSVLEEV